MKKIIKTKLKCERCNITVERVPSQIGKRIFCSQICRKNIRIKKICETCNNNFELPDYQLKYKQNRGRFCTRQCANLGAYKGSPAQNGRKTCSYCGIGKSISSFAKNKSNTDGYQSSCKDCQSNKRLLKIYNISKAEYVSRIKKQNKKCLICLQERPLVVDHDHNTQKVRGLLCNNCNMAIGLLEDSVDYLENAKKYITQ